MCRCDGLTNGWMTITLRDVWLRLVALILVLAMWPAAGETFELVVHVAEHGDLGHGADDEHESTPFGESEHGCSSTFHLCGAAFSAPMRVTPHVTALAVPHTARDLSELPAPTDAVGVDDPAPLMRPPIA